MLCKRTPKNQLTIPKAIADHFPGVNPHFSQPRLMKPGLRG